MELHDALVEIAEIRRQLARSEQFRGYRGAPVAMSGLLALVAAAWQALWIADPASELSRYLTLWIGTAGFSAALCLGDIWLRYRRSEGLLHRELTQLALAQFFPCVAAGGLLTGVLMARAPQVAWMLPGLWSIVFSLGLFASARLLPRAITAVALYYLLAGCGYLWQGESRAAFSPWAMAATFGIGQWAAAAVLFSSDDSATDQVRD